MRIPVISRMRLEGKAFVLIGLTLAVCIAFSYWLVSRAQRDVVMGEVRRRAEFLSEQIVDVTRAQSVAVVRARRRFGLQMLPRWTRHLIEGAVSGIRLSHPLAYDSRRVAMPQGSEGRLVRSPGGRRWYAWRFLSGKGRVDVSMMTPFEKRAWSKLSDPTGRLEEIEEPALDEDVFRYARRLRVREHCVTCHHHADWVDRVGDPNRNTVGVLALEMDVHEQQQELGRSNRIYLWAAVVTFLATLAMLYLVVLFLMIRPLGHLKDVSDRISVGDLSARAELHTGDEMESFAGVFNRMVENVQESQRRLEDLNRSLDEKVGELGQANLRLFESNRLRSQFLANVSHELRTPLNAIIGFSELLGERRAGEGDDKQARYARNILTAGHHLLRLINELLDLARIESGKITVNLGRTSLKDVVQNVVTMREGGLKEGQTLAREVADDVPSMLTDEGKLTQIVDNLIGNAVKFTDPGGRIELTARRDGDFVEIAVSDDGIGIAKADQEHIFDKFRQADASNTRRHAGAGLGLAIVKEFVTMLGGTVTLRSEVGKGSAFTVRLPIESPPWTPPAHTGAEIG